MTNKTQAEMLQPAMKADTPEKVAIIRRLIGDPMLDAKLDGARSKRELYGRLLYPKQNWLVRKLKAWRDERRRQRELEARMDTALIDHGFLDRASAGEAARRIDRATAKLAEEGLRRLRKVQGALGARAGF